MVFVAGQKLRASDLNDSFAADDCEGEYNMAVDQTAATGGSTPLLFGTTNRSSSLITKGTSGTGSTFTVGRDGVWAIGAVIRYNGNGSAAFTAAYLRIDGAVHCMAAQFTADIIVLNPCIPAIRLTSGQVVTVDAYHERGTTATVDANNSTSMGRLYLAYLHP